MALKCVELGIYKNIVEAMETQRKGVVERSEYKYKHLLYR